MKTRFAGKARRLSRLAVGAIQALGKRKVFCIGRNKTGTTSVAAAWRELGYTVGDQGTAELLLRDWARRDFRRIALYCHTAQAFQDVPFSLPFTFQAMDQRCPGSKFILTVRDSPEQWCDSLVRYYTVTFGRDGRLPTMDDLKAATYRQRGWLYESTRLMRDVPDNDPFNKEALIGQYVAHNTAILEYFRHRPHDLLVLNVAQPGAYDRLCDFLGKPRVHKEFPWENRTADVHSRP
jgi:hypothetical protein